MHRFAWILGVLTISTACRNDECGEDKTRVKGTFNMAGSVFSIDETNGKGLNFSTTHKIDVDDHESGCLSNIDIKIKNDGLGCELDLALVPGPNEDYVLSSFNFSADSYCPNFDDDLEGQYISDGSNSDTTYDLPHQIDMKTGTEKEVCQDNVDHSLEINGTLQSESTATGQPFSLKLTISGDYISTGSTSADCEVQEPEVTETPDDDFEPVNEESDGWLSAGQSHTCSIDEAETIECWGENEDGQSTPPAGAFKYVSAGAWHSCGVTTTGEAVCWGSDYSNQSSPPTGKFASVTAGKSHSCGLTDTGKIKCWGKNDHGQASPPSGTFFKVSAGDTHTCAIAIGGQVQCWGSTNSSLPPTGNFNDLDAGGGFTCAVANSREIICWGPNTWELLSPPDGTFSQVTAGGSHACGIKMSGETMCWGSESSAPGLRNTEFITISAGDNHSCGMKADRSVECWGLIP